MRRAFGVSEANGGYSYFWTVDRGVFLQPAQISRSAVDPVYMVRAVAGTKATGTHAGPGGQVEPLLPDHVTVCKTKHASAIMG